MLRRTCVGIAWLLFVCFAVGGECKKDPVIEAKIQALLAKMTVSEKAAQMCIFTAPVKNGYFSDPMAYEDMNFGIMGYDPHPPLWVGATFANWYQSYSIQNSNHSIPAILYDEGVHGLYGWGHTVFPQAIAIASTFNPDLANKVAKAVAAESRSLGINLLLSPVLDLAREPRWGRVEETFGEDTYLCSVMGRAVVDGYQGDSLATNYTVVSEPKHFTAHGITEGGHNAGFAHVGRRELYDTFLPVFKAALIDSNARAVMSAYTDIDGIPCTANKWLLTDLLRNEWGFDGIALSDGMAIANLVNINFMAATPEEAITLSINAGLDVDMGSYDGPIFINAIVNGVAAGIINESRIDDAVANILRVKYELGLFDNPYTDPSLAAQVIRSKAHTDLALQAARESIVLLKNNNNILPLIRNRVLKIALIGPSADTLRLGDYTGVWDQELPPHSAGSGGVTLLEGLTAAAKPSGSTVTFRVGTGILLDTETQIIRKSHLNGGNGLKAEYYANSNLSGAPVVSLYEDQLEWYWDYFAPYPGLNFSDFSARYTATVEAPFSVDGAIGITTNGGFRLYIDSKLVVDAWTGAKSKTTTTNVAFVAGKSLGLTLEFRKTRDGSGFLMLSWDLVGSGSFDESVQIAKQSDIAIVAVGDSALTVGESFDRADLVLTGKQQQLVQAIAATGTPTIVIIMNGRPTIVSDFVDSVDAVINAFYPGEAQGTALADVLFGNYNPSGKLPISVPYFVGQLPVYYNYKPDARNPYVDMGYLPQFPFGFGLSYTTFEFSNLKYIPILSRDDSAVQAVSVDVRNSGNFDGDEVVQLYVRDMVSTVSTPIKQLKRFQKVRILSRQSTTVQFTLPVKELSLLNADMEWVVEPGLFTLWVGNSSATGLSASFRVN